MRNSLAGKTAVVTGAERGIGASIAQVLAMEGAAVALIGRDAARLEAQAKTMSTDTLIAPADVTDPQSVQAAFSKIRERFSRIHILVNNAGQAESAPFARSRFPWNLIFYLQACARGTHALQLHVLRRAVYSCFGFLNSISLRLRLSYPITVGIRESTERSQRSPNALVA